MRLNSWTVAYAVQLVVGCAATGELEPADFTAGEAVYRATVEDGNTFSCATCHAIDDAADEYRRPGHPLGDAAGRPTYKGGQLVELREAVNSCLTEWMNAEAWLADDLRWIDLEEFLRGQAPDTAAPVDLRIVAPPADLDGGDAARGREVFDGTCAACHDEGGTGTNLAPALAGLSFDPGYVATRVRTSGRSNSAVYDGLTGGIMPFWSEDRLSNDELRDIIAWLASEAAASDDDASDDDASDDDASDEGATDDDASDDGGSSSDSDGDSSDGGEPIPQNCQATDYRVGWIADLETSFHNVGGRAEIVDDCTVVIHDFTYDGTGIDVRIYGGVGGDYDNGYAMTDDLLLPGGYNGVLLEAVLPEGRTLDDLEGISVWCVDVGIDFGSGVFYPP